MHEILPYFQPHDVNIVEAESVHQSSTTVTKFSRISTILHYRPSIRELTDLKELAVGSV